MAAGLDLGLDKQNPMKDLIAKATNEQDEHVYFERYVIKHLGKRYEKLTVINEKDCIKIKPKGWLDKQVWKEINDILRVHQFAWLSNGRDSCWIKMSNGAT